MRIRFEHDTEKKEGNFSKKIVILVITINIIFTIATFGAFIRTGNEPATLITAWFAFTTVELWELSKIKRSDKTKKKQEEEV